MGYTVLQLIDRQCVARTHLENTSREPMSLSSRFLILPPDECDGSLKTPEGYAVTQAYPSGVYMFQKLKSDAEIVVVRAETPECGTVKFFPVVRMCYADKHFCTFLHRTSIQVDSSVFGDYPVHVRP